MTAEPIETRDRALIEAHKAKDGKVEVFMRGSWRECTLDRHGVDTPVRCHRLLPIESPGGDASTREGEDAGWHVEQTDPEQPPRLVYWSPDDADCAVIDVDDLLYAIEERTSRLDGYLAEKAITDLCTLVTQALRNGEREGQP